MNPPDPISTPPGSLTARQRRGRGASRIAVGCPDGDSWRSRRLAGLAAGGLAWAAGETRAVDSGPAEKRSSFMGSETMMPQVSFESQQAAVRLTSTKAFGILGGLTGLLLGLVGGATAGSARRAALAGGVGLAVGGLLGAGVTWATLPAFERGRAADTGDLLASLLMHGAFWIPIGAAGGLALGLGRRDRIASAMVGGALGALVGTVAYELIGGMVFPMAETGAPISLTATTRLLGRLLVPTLAAVGATLALTRRVPTPEVAALLQLNRPLAVRCVPSREVGRSGLWERPARRARSSSTGPPSGHPGRSLRGRLVLEPSCRSPSSFPASSSPSGG